MAVSPEEIGLCGCWQVIAVERQSQDLTQPDEPASLEIGCYATSLTVDQREDACRTAGRQGAAVLASLRNLAMGVHELQKERQRTRADSLRSWCQQQTFSTVWPILQR